MWTTQEWTSDGGIGQTSSDVWRTKGAGGIKRAVVGGGRASYLHMTANINGEIVFTKLPEVREAMRSVRGGGNMQEQAQV